MESKLLYNSKGDFDVLSGIKLKHNKIPMSGKKQDVEVWALICSCLKKILILLRHFETHVNNLQK